MIHPRFLFAFAVVASSASAIAAPTTSGRVVLGQLGQAINSTAIHSRPTGFSSIYYRVQAYQYLVVRKTRNANWTAVLLNTGGYGYVPTRSIVKLPYEYTSPATSRQAMTLTSRGGAASVANYAQNFVGTPYKWGGNDVYGGIDCSGFVKKMYGAIGKELPRTAAEQATVGTPIDRLENLQPGDRLYFWEAKRGKVGHTGIYLGGGYFIHSSSGHHGVAKDYLGSENWLRLLCAARR